jgi:hypothetical protein
MRVYYCDGFENDEQCAFARLMPERYQWRPIPTAHWGLGRDGQVILSKAFMKTIRGRIALRISEIPSASGGGADDRAAEDL